MSNALSINMNLSENEKYESLLTQINSLLNPDEPLISNLANITAVLKTAFDKISWVGFYLSRDEKLFLGPFQGNVACTVIENGKGVCGLSALKRESIIVDDVAKFPGHIACEAGTRSEIVIPLMNENRVYGVLDADSYRHSAFTDTDKLYLEKLCNSLVKKLPFDNLVI